MRRGACATTSPTRAEQSERDLMRIYTVMGGNDARAITFD